MVSIERASSGRPSMDIGISPSPMAPTSLVPIRRCSIVSSCLNFLARSTERSPTGIMQTAPSQYAVLARSTKVTEPRLPGIVPHVGA